MRRIRSHLTYANVVSTLCLFILLGGIGYAASKIGTSDIENGAVTAKKLHKKAVTTKKLRNGAVNSAKIANRQVRAADLGPITEKSATTSVPHNMGTESALAECPVGTRLISGGGFTSVQGMSLAVDKAQGNSWRVDANNETPVDGSVTAFAYCLAQ